MDKESCEKLVQAVYRVTELFPANEPLKWQIRESANRILADLVCPNPNKKQIEEALKNIEILKSYFNIAQPQNWVNPANLLVLAKEYNKVGEAIQLQLADMGKSVDNFLPGKQKIAKDSEEGRRNKILEFLRERKQAKTKELLSAFPFISRRTMLRDMAKFYQSGVLIKVGSGRGSYYSIKL